MTRDEHITWVKERAYQEIDFYKDGHKGIISVMSDLGKHEETQRHPAIQLGMAMMLTGSLKDPQTAKKWIDGIR